MIPKKPRGGKIPPRPRHVEPEKAPPQLPRMLFHVEARACWPDQIESYRRDGFKVLTAEEAAPLVGKSAEQLVADWVGSLKWFMSPVFLAAHLQAEKDAAGKAASARKRPRGKGAR